ncbi:MAG: hypothetical protein K6T63_10570 [Alicyclobacillus herbarius]|uniref:hypothetical protein n=1 Tax=Alicyclobacillus herbarius TaxID=122960 RepID=UPI000686289D|nr:hypothetical protein [Alicyclobacillus herbarius]MCL6633062.1 hypothetical protein [Alicyclobacillus herbarius]
MSQQVQRKTGSIRRPRGRSIRIWHHRQPCARLGIRWRARGVCLAVGWSFALVFSGMTSSIAWAAARADADAKASHPVVYQVVTDEIRAKQADGSVKEVYRFDPGVYVVNQGDTVDLRIRGLKGHTHPVYLEHYNVQGVVQRNQVLSLQFHADKPGVFRLICTSHQDAAHEGPMEGYLVVVPKHAHGHSQVKTR